MPHLPNPQLAAASNALAASASRTQHAPARSRGATPVPDAAAPRQQPRAPVDPSSFSEPSVELSPSATPSGERRSTNGPVTGEERRSNPNGGGAPATPAVAAAHQRLQLRWGAAHQRLQQRRRCTSDSSGGGEHSDPRAPETHPKPVGCGCRIPPAGLSRAGFFSVPRVWPRVGFCCTRTRIRECHP